MIQGKVFNQILDEICKEQNISIEPLSYGWIKKLTKDGKIRYVMENRLDLNSAISQIIAQDKFATFEVLKSNNIPTIEHRMIFNPKTRSNFYKNKFIEDAKELLKENKKVVIKANDSSEGKDVYYCITDKEIEDIVIKLFEEENDTLSACPYIDIDYEYRTVYLDGEIEFVYKKKKAFVTGDGNTSVKELINNKFSYLNHDMDLIRELDLNYVPKKDEEVTVSWKHNLYNGAEPILIDENDPFVEEVKKVSKQAGDASRIKFATIDVALTKDKKILVMEINSSVCFTKFAQLIPSGYEITKSIYLKAINKMFED